VPELDLNTMLRQTHDLRGSDLHLRVDLPPKVRVHGIMRTLEGYAPLTGEQLKLLLETAITADQAKKFGQDWQLDFSYRIPGVARFRVNYFRESGQYAAVFRRIPDEIPSLPELNAPRALVGMATLPRGLVLVTGPTSSGKTTTLAALIDIINEQRHGHILTIEDPIEFVHRPRNCVVSQREIGRDAKGFNEAIVAAMREDPDVILVGEMRDLETMATAITAAETGHLVLATLHTSSAAETVHRIIDVFPESQQPQIRTQLAAVLKGVFCQALLPRADGKGRIAAHEVMIVNPAIAANIKEGNVNALHRTIGTSARLGMQTLDRSLAFLVSKGLIEEEEGRLVAERQENSEFSSHMKSVKEGQEITLPGFVTWHDLPEALRPQAIRAAEEMANGLASTPGDGGFALGGAS